MGIGETISDIQTCKLFRTVRKVRTGSNFSLCFSVMCFVKKFWRSNLTIFCNLSGSQSVEIWDSEDFQIVKFQNGPPWGSYTAPPHSPPNCLATALRAVVSTALWSILNSSGLGADTCLHVCRWGTVIKVFSSAGMRGLLPIGAKWGYPPSTKVWFAHHIW